MTTKSCSSLWRSIFRPDLFRNQYGIVTGGGTGIGYQVAKEILLLDGSVLICSRNIEKLKKAKEMILSSLPANCKGQIDIFPCNVRNAKDIEDMVNYALYKSPIRIRKLSNASLSENEKDQIGHINFLVNNAGGQFVSPLEASTRRR